MKKSLMTVFKCLANRPNNIFVWVKTNKEMGKYTPLRVGRSSAIEWAKQCAAENRGEIPCEISEFDIFLGIRP